MKRFIEAINKAKAAKAPPPMRTPHRKRAQKRREFTRHYRHVKLSYVTQEPNGWPLKRPAKPTEWSHVLRAMIVRRVPKSRPIHQDKLIKYVTEDLLEASRAGKIYVGPEFRAMRQVVMELQRIICNGTLHQDSATIDDPEMGYPAQAISRTDRTDGWLSRVPVTVQAVVDFLPVTNLLDMMVQALVDSDEDCLGVRVT